MRPPIKINGERVLGKGPWNKNLVVQSYMNSRTNEIYEYGIFKVESPPCTIIFPVTDDFNVIAIRQYRHAADQFILELPGGMPEDGDSCEENAAKELMAETGYSTSYIEKLISSLIYFDPCSLTTRFQPFLARRCIGLSGQKLDAIENIEVAKMPIDDWLHRIERGEVRDAKSIVTTFLAMRVLGMK